MKNDSYGSTSTLLTARHQPLPSPFVAASRVVPLLVGTTVPRRVVGPAGGGQMGGLQYIRVVYKLVDRAVHYFTSHNTI